MRRFTQSNPDLVVAKELLPEELTKCRAYGQRDGFNLQALDRGMIPVVLLARVSEFWALLLWLAAANPAKSGCTRVGGTLQTLSFVQIRTVCNRADLPFLAFWDFLAFFVARNFLAFFERFPFLYQGF